jgi:enoyl-CoA hydratase
MPEVKLDVANGVATLTLDAPERRNAITPSMAHAMIGLLQEVDHNPEVGALVLRGEGKSFCAGANLDTLENANADPASDDVFTALSAIYQSFVLVGRVGVPTIIAARGAAVGAGLNLFLAGDLRIVARDARLFSGFDRLGIHPGGGHFVLLSRSVPRDVAAAMGVFGEELTGQQAAETGMAWRAVAADEVDATALELAGRCAKDPDLSRKVISAFRMESGPPTVPWDVGVQAERASQMWSLRRRA